MMLSDSPTLPGNQFHKAYALDDHSQQAFLKPNSKLEFAVSNSKAHFLRDIAISPLQGQYLALQCQLIGAKSVLELGTLGGYSTIWFASSGAKVTSIEIDPKHHAVATENTKGLDVELILGSALDVMPRLIDEGRKFDFVFIDADWDEQWKYFELASSLTRLNGCIYVDNVVREILESGGLEGKGESLVTKVGQDERVEATIVPTVCSHKNPEEMFDGFLLAVVKR